MASSVSVDSVKFMQFQSVIDQSFWHKLCQLKLDVERLEENERSIWGLHLQPGICSVYIDYSSFNREVDWRLYSSDFTSLEGLCSPDSRCNFPLVAIKGVLKNYNKLESFKNCDKTHMISCCGDGIRQDIISGRALQHPALLTTFILITYADLKKYDFYYWFSFPASLSCQASYVDDGATFSHIIPQHQWKEFFKSHKELAKEQRTVFGIKLESGSPKCITLEQLISHYNEGRKQEVYLCFLDPSNNVKYPGWPLRNILALIAYHWKEAEGNTLRVISFRVSPSFYNSPVFNISLSVIDKDMSKWVGWEKNTRDKLGPRFTSLKDTMDPVRLADTSAELNLKLMKWRLAPDLNLDVISKQRALILGAGTLGCALARNLMSWGVKTITFVDNGTVSYSNPVRQCLYNITDCLQDKAICAAKALKQILPSINSTGIVLDIPMPGHSTASLTNATKLHQLIENHDAVFLVTDSRESRWLPTLIAASLSKITITSAIGFDTYLVMRHCTKTGDDESDGEGCYFCKDVTAPGDSTGDRTLDQQCTVSRPGVSNIAAALAAELYISSLQPISHPQVSSAKVGNSSCSNVKQSDECLLGVVPHSIRGFLSTYNHIMPSTSSFSKCTACSSSVIHLYNSDRLNFLTNVFNSNTYLEEVTGLAELKKITEDIQDLSLSEEESGLEDD